MTAFIYYTGSSNLPVILTQLQPQLSINDDIYVVDITKDRSGVKLAKLYGSTRCFIFVEVGDYSFEKAFSFALQSMKENDQDSLLVLPENAVISSTFITNLKRASKIIKDSIISPVVLEVPYSQFPNNFRWYNPVPHKLGEGKTSEVCFFINSLQPVLKEGILLEETVVLLPNKSS